MNQHDASEPDALSDSGDGSADGQDGLFGQGQVEMTTGPTATAFDEGGLGESGEGRLELLTELELRSDETTDPRVATEEGLAYVPPTDPPVVPSDAPGGLAIAAGMSASAWDEPFDADHHGSLLPGEDETTARVREALLADAATTQYAESLEIETSDGRVLLAGTVDDLDDDDNVVAVASTVTGVDEVIDRLDVAGM